MIWVHTLVNATGLLHPEVFHAFGCPGTLVGLPTVVEGVGDLVDGVAFVERYAADPAIKRGFTRYLNHRNTR